MHYFASHFFPGDITRTLHPAILKYLVCLNCGDDDDNEELTTILMTIVVILLTQIDNNDKSGIIDVDDVRDYSM